MTTVSLATGNQTMVTAMRPRRSLEELVDRLMAALFREKPETAAPATTAKQSVPGASTLPGGSGRRGTWTARWRF